MPISAGQRQCRSPRVRPRQPHDVSLACGNQPAYEKLLNRRIRAGALTSAPAHPAIIRTVLADPVPLGSGACNRS